MKISDLPKGKLLVGKDERNFTTDEVVESACDIIELGGNLDGVTTQADIIVRAGKMYGWVVCKSK